MDGKLEQRRILIIAGSDSSGGAGLEADQKVIAAHGCYAMTATTALTAQNTKGVEDIHHIPPSFVKKCIDLCIEDVGVDVVKCGMLASAETVKVVADAFRRHNIPTSVVDPVMISTSGSQLLPEQAVRTLRESLLPVTTILTPNLPEAQLLLNDAGLDHRDPKQVEDLVAIAEAVQSLGPEYVLLKGGHVPLKGSRIVSNANEATKEAVFDVLSGQGKTVIFETEYIISNNTHGTGCSLASAIASNLACGLPVPLAIKKAGQYIEAGIKTARNIGQGSGPINHFHSSYMLPFAPGRFLEYLQDRPDVGKPWKHYVGHEFVAQLAFGTLPIEAFKHYLIQDYLYLIQFARANALASYKAKTMDDVVMSAGIVKHIHEEMKLHLSYCAEFGLSKEEVETKEEDQACTAYTRYMLEVGQASDWFALQMALAPCLLGYGEIARRLYDDPKTVRGENNRYWKWIENYVEDDFVQAVTTGRELIERHATKQSPERIEELVKIFVHATKMESGFWDMGLSAA